MPRKKKILNGDSIHCRPSSSLCYACGAKVCSNCGLVNECGEVSTDEDDCFRAERGLINNSSESARQRRMFFAYVVIGDPDDCWPFNAATKGRYGNYYVGGGRTALAHRVAYEFVKGSIDRGMYILHGCNNSTCCNPNHLRQGTHQDNMQDKAKKDVQLVGLDLGKVNTILQMAYDGHGKEEIAELFAIDKTLAEKIIKRKIFTTLEGVVEPNEKS